MIDLIKATYGLNAKGEHFLGLEDLNFQFDGSFTYQQAHMEIKDFVCAGLLQPGMMFETKPATAKEILSPATKNFITKEWLMKIDPRLPKHVRDTRGHLFTLERPSLACNQRILCDQMATMLAELDSKPNSSQGNISMGYIPTMRGATPRGRYDTRNNPGRGILRGAGVFRGGPRPPLPSRAPVQRAGSGCFRCLEATPTRYDAAQTHQVRNCPWPPIPGMHMQQPRRNPPNFKVVLFPENAQQPQMATVAMGNSSIYQQEDGQQQYDDTQYYDPQYYNQGPSIVEIPETDYVNFVDPVENTNILYYEWSNLSFQSINCQQIDDKIIIQNIPTRKVQTIACEINGKVAKLTIDSGSEGDCLRRMHTTRYSCPALRLKYES